MEDVMLYHGSRGGIEGDIHPISRVRCDFGKGFYMGESPEQAKGLVAEDSDPVFYTLRFRLSEIPESRILVLSGEDWMNAILANRKRCEEFNQLRLARHWIKELAKYDVIIGDIADDRMNIAMQRFSDYGLTDKGLIACLQYVNYGMQYVAKTDFACSKIDILTEQRFNSQEMEEIRQYANSKRNEGKNIVNLMAREHQRDGLYLNEIIEREQKKERRKHGNEEH